MNDTLALWAGPACATPRVGERFQDPMALCGFAERIDDIDRLATLGVTRVQLPLLWERHAVRADAEPDVSWARPRIERLQAHGIAPMACLLHHGSGPRDTDLLDPRFPERLAAYARHLARHFPHIDAWTPVHAPLATASFAGLQGLWHPHRHETASFVRILLNQVQAIAQAMAAIREVIPRAQLVQTLGPTPATLAAPDLPGGLQPALHWLPLDLLAGRVTPGHPLRSWLQEHGADEALLQALAQAACLPDLVGLQGDVADLPALRALAREASRRYGRPLAFTEVHRGGPRERQLLGLHQAWRLAQDLRAEGIEVQAVSHGAAFGLYHADRLPRSEADYEPGLWDTRCDPPRPTALASLAARLARGAPLDLPVLQALEAARPPESSPRRAGRPLLITGATTTLGQACARVCAARGLPYLLLSKAEMDAADAASVDAALARWRPWAVVDAQSLSRLDDAERAPRRSGPPSAGALARACTRDGVRLLVFSTDKVFDGQVHRPWVESDLPRPSEAAAGMAVQAEQLIAVLAPQALVARTGALFNPWDRQDFLARALAALRRGERLVAPCDARVSPTCVPDLLETALDLLVDGEQGLWHLTHGGAVAWDQFARLAAQAAGLDASRVQGAPAASLGAGAPRARCTALASERGLLMPPLEEGLRHYLQMLEDDPQPPPRRSPEPAPQEAPADWTLVADDAMARAIPPPLPWPVGLAA